MQRAGNMSIVFCLLLNRVHFVRDKGLTTASLSRTRASLCEILAIRTMRDYGDHLLDLALVATTSWPVYAGADPDVLARAQEDNDNLEDRVGNAIEMAILSKAKGFIKSTPCQKVIDAIWRFVVSVFFCQLYTNTLSVANVSIRPTVVTRFSRMYVFVLASLVLLFMNHRV